MELIGAQNTSNEFTAITECTCYAIAVIFHRNCGKYEEKRPMIFSVPLDTAKQKQDNINECLLCNRRNFKMKAIKKIIPVLLILVFVYDNYSKQRTEI